MVPNGFNVWHRLLKLHRTSGGVDTISFHLESDTQQVSSQVPYRSSQFGLMQPDAMQELVVTAILAPGVQMRLVVDPPTLSNMGNLSGLESLLLEHGIIS